MAGGQLVTWLFAPRLQVDIEVAVWTGFHNGRLHRGYGWLQDFRRSLTLVTHQRVVLAALSALGCRFWLEGGWGVAEQTLRGDGDAGNRNASQRAGDEEGPRKDVETPVEGRLPGAAVLVDEQWVQVHPTAARSMQLDPVGTPVGLLGVAQLG